MVFIYSFRLKKKKDKIKILSAHSLLSQLLTTTPNSQITSNSQITVAASNNHLRPKMLQTLLLHPKLFRASLFTPPP